ncbi:Plasmid replication initiator protein [Candidatus Burkholderia verschuerenii]|uniref:Plasmid replication initiator protein n=1 Tax=Candidatus Burkholderia verschuerenii TaxID=242163 RepID=A0A0L0MBP5_9BURK|nr:Plasmid replication initiator protein [Candidatus Burkholderia verschuerenii]
MAAPRERRPRTYLTIDYDSKDWAKRHGARWDKVRKRWYVLGEVSEMLLPYVDGSLAPKEVPEEERQKQKAKALAMAARPKKSLREPPQGDAQADFFVPGVWDVAAKDNRGIMDVAVFRLSKKHARANEVMLHELPDGHVRVTSGPDGMASIWDYDIVLMGVSHLTEAMNRFRAGQGEKPGRVFRPHVSEILKFGRQADGGRQYEAVEASLRRLKQTTIEIVRRGRGRGWRPIRVTESAGLISDYKAVSHEDTGRVASVEIELPKWLYEAVVEA